MNKTNRGEKIVKALANSFLNHEGVFNDTSDLLECQKPEGVDYGSKQHARFYFFLIFNDHGTKSSALYERFKAFYKRKPDFFSPTKINQLDEGGLELLKAEVSGLGLRYPGQAVTSWVHNAKMLVDQFESEPINLLTSTQDAQKLFKSIMDFRSYGPKTSGLLLRVCIGVGFLKFPRNLEDVPLPVDIHDSRIAYETELYRPDDVQSLKEIYSSPRRISEVERVWRAASNSSNVDWETIDRALWILGSRGCVKRKCGICPIASYCRIGKELLGSENDLFSNTAL